MAKRRGALDCRGHEPQHWEPQGITTYCDGSCRLTEVVWPMPDGVYGAKPEKNSGGLWSVCRWHGVDREWYPVVEHLSVREAVAEMRRLREEARA